MAYGDVRSCWCLVLAALMRARVRGICLSGGSCSLNAAPTYRTQSVQQPRLSLDQAGSTSVCSVGESCLVQPDRPTGYFEWWRNQQNSLQQNSLSSQHLAHRSLDSRLRIWYGEPLLLCVSTVFVCSSIRLAVCLALLLVLETLGCVLCSSFCLAGCLALLLCLAVCLGPLFAWLCALLCCYFWLCVLQFNWRRLAVCLAHVFA